MIYEALKYIKKSSLCDTSGESTGLNRTDYRYYFSMCINAQVKLVSRYKALLLFLKKFYNLLHVVVLISSLVRCEIITSNS